jgi:WS/DGAT/MGAT family acyltransferase
MPTVKQLNKEDVMFVAGETDTIYQHVAALIVLDGNDRPEFNFESFRQRCIDRISLLPQFQWKLHEVPMGLDRPYWVEDENFSYDHHIKHIAIPSPGDSAALSEVAAHLYSRTLDRSKPLWELWLIEGLEGGKFAFLQKFHHCMMDGEGALKFIETTCDFESDPQAEKTVAEAISQARAGKVPSSQQQSTRAARHLARMPGKAAKSIYDILRPKIIERLAWPKKPKPKKPVIPTASFNGKISSDRGFVFGNLSLQDIKNVKNHFNVSVNDVILATVSGAIRNYLLQTSELPEDSLRTNIAVSIRTESDDNFSNKVTTTTVTLATDLQDPVERLRAINNESEQAKTQARAGAIGVTEMFQMMPPILVSTVMGSLPAGQAPQLLGGNLVVSNVRGSPLPMYAAGARIEAMYPMSILIEGLGINLTCISYVDKIDFGIILDPNLVPEPWLLDTELKNTLAVYTALIKPKPRARKKAVTRRKAAVKKATATSNKAAARKKAAVKKKTVAKKSPAKKKTTEARKKSPKK